MFILSFNALSRRTIKLLSKVLFHIHFNKMSAHSTGYNFGSVQIKPMKFVDDIADPSREKASVIASDSVLEAIQLEK